MTAEFGRSSYQTDASIKEHRTAKVTITVLITPEEVDRATDLAKEKSGVYRPPGH